jgi:ADP-heptose:LPS heptosyltransferase
MDERSSNSQSLLFDPLTKKPFQKIGIFRALHLGDLLCSVPAFRALRRALPEASISLIGLPWAESFVDIYRDYIDEFIQFPGYPGLSERNFDSVQFPKFLELLHSRSFDLMIQMHGSGQISNPLVALFGARYMCGFYTLENFCPDPTRFLPHTAITHEVWRNLELVRSLGAHPQGEELEFFSKDQDFIELNQMADLSKETICLHPGAKADSRRWPKEKFAAVGDFFAQRGYQIAVTGTEAESRLVEDLISQMKYPALNLAGKTNLRTLAALIQHCRLLICNDTGVSHLAVALRSPSVVVFTRSEFLGWPPLNRQRHRVLARFDGASVPEVLEQATDLLSKPHSRPAPSRAPGKEALSRETLQNTDLAYTR